MKIKNKIRLFNFPISLSKKTRTAKTKKNIPISMRALFMQLIKLNCEAKNNAAKNAYDSFIWFLYKINSANGVTDNSKGVTNL